MRPGILSVAVFVFAAALLHPAAAFSKHTHPIKPSAAGLDSALRSFCSHTVYSELCIKSIKEAAPGLRAPNSNTVLAALMRAVGVKAREGKIFALNLAKQHASGAKALELLRDCADAYDTALGNLADANKAIRARDYGARDSLINSMIPNFGSCDDGFQEFRLRSPMAARTKTLKNMVDNCLAIVNMSRPKGSY